MPSMTSTTSPQRPKPAHELRLGAIKAAIWRNETDTGPRFNTTFSRSYRDADQWHNTDSFGRDDLLLVAKIADQAHSWICAQGRDAGPPPAPDAGPRRPVTGPAPRDR